MEWLTNYELLIYSIGFLADNTQLTVIVLKMWVIIIFNNYKINISSGYYNILSNKWF